MILSLFTKDISFIQLPLLKGWEKPKYTISALKIQGSPYLSSTPMIISSWLINSGIFFDLMRV